MYFVAPVTDNIVSFSLFLFSKVEPPPDLSQVVVVIDTVFYNALDKMLNAGLIPSIATGEIIR